MINEEIKKLYKKVIGSFYKRSETDKLIDDEIIKLCQKHFKDEVEKFKKKLKDKCEDLKTCDFEGIEDAEQYIRAIENKFKCEIDKLAGELLSKLENQNPQTKSSLSDVNAPMNQMDKTEDTDNQGDKKW